jgi:hypothetical protein
MPRPTITQRLRAFLNQRLGAEWGGAAALAKFSQDRPGGSKIRAQNLSAFRRETPGRVGLKLDHLDDIAAYFRVPIAALFGEQSALTGDEQRLLWAFRALPLPTREQFLGLVELASVAQQKSRNVGERRIAKSLETSTMMPIPQQAHGEVAHGSSASGSLPAVVRESLERVITDLANLVATLPESGAAGDLAAHPRPAHGSGPPQAGGR